MLDLDAIEKLLAEATPGPLTICLGSGEHLCTGLMNEETAQFVCDFLPDYFLSGAVKTPIDHRPDMNLFLALHNAAPTLLALARAGRRLAETGLMVIYAHIGDSQPRPFVFCSDCGAEAAEAKDIVHEDGCEAGAWLVALAAFREADGG